MNRSPLPPGAQAAVAERYIQGAAPQDPLEPILKAVQDALLRKFRVVSHRRGSVALLIEDVEVPVRAPTRARATPSDAELRDALGSLIGTALRSSLTDTTDEGRRRRLWIAQALIGLETAGPTAKKPSPEEGTDAWLTTAEVAGQLGVSRPYVSMLCDAGKLGEVTKTTGGHRRIRRSAVSAYSATQLADNATAVSPREAGVAAGMYALDDGAYLNAARRSAVKPASKTIPKTRRAAKA